MQQNVQSQQYAQLNNYSKERNSNLSKIQQSQNLNHNIKPNQININSQGVYFNGKYYLSDQQTLKKLKQVENQIQKEKQMIIKLKFNNVKIKNKKKNSQLNKQYQDMTGDQKSYYSLNNQDYQHQISNIQCQNIDIKTQLNMTILEERQIHATQQLQTQQEKYRENIRKAQLKRTQLKRKLVQEQQIQIKTMNLKEYSEKKKKNSFNLDQIELTQQPKLSSNQQNQQSNLNLQIPSKELSIKKISNQQQINIQQKQKSQLKSHQTSKNQINSQNQSLQQREQSSLKEKQSQPQISQKNNALISQNCQNISNQKQTQVLNFQNNRSMKSNKDQIKSQKQLKQQTQIIKNQSQLNQQKYQINSKMSQKNSTSKKYSIKKSTVIIPQNNQTLQQIQSRKNSKIHSSRISQIKKNIQQKQISQKSLNKSQNKDFFQPKDQNQQNQIQIQKQNSIKKSVKNQQIQKSKINSLKQHQNQQIQHIEYKNIQIQDYDKSIKEDSRITKTIKEDSQVISNKFQSIKKQNISVKSSVKSKPNQKVQLMYVPHAPSSHKSFKKTDKSIQWSQIDISMYGKTNQQQSRLSIQQNQIIKSIQNSKIVQSKHDTIQLNKINMKKNKINVELNPIVINKQKSQKSNKLISQKSKSIKEDLIRKQQDQKVKKSQKSFILHSREGSVKQRTQKYEKFSRDHSLNQKSFKSNNKQNLEPIQKLQKIHTDLQKNSKKAASYRSRKSSIGHHGNSAINKSNKALSFKQSNTVSVVPNKQVKVQQFFDNQLSQVEASKVLVSKQQIKILHNQIKLLEQKLCKIEQKQQNIIKQKNQDINKLQNQVKSVQKQVQQLKNKQKNEFQKEKQQQVQIIKQQQKEKVKDIQENNEILKQRNEKMNEQNIKNQHQIINNKQQKQIQQNFKQQKDKLLDQISRLRRIIRDLQIQKIKSIDNDKTITIQPFVQPQKNVYNKEQEQNIQYGHIVHQNNTINQTINKSEDNNILHQNILNRSMRKQKLDKSQHNHSKSPIGKIVKNLSPQKNSSIMIDGQQKSQDFTSERRNNNKFRINLTKKASITSENVLAKTFESNQFQINNNYNQAQKNNYNQVQRIPVEHSIQMTPKSNKINQNMISSKSAQFNEITSSLKHQKNSQITKQQVLQKFYKTNREFHNFIQSSRIINETNSSFSVSNQSNTNGFNNIHRSNQSNLMTDKKYQNQIISSNSRAQVDEFNPQANSMLQNVSLTELNQFNNNNKQNLKNSFTRIIEEIRNQPEQSDEKVPNIQLKEIKYPQLPNTPTIQMNQQQLMNLAKKTFKAFDIQIHDEDHDFTMKKYKNCIILTKGIDTILWHYTGKFYMGGWKSKQNGQGQKTGQGIEIIPEKHIYRGQFLNGKKHGTGIMKSQNGNIYDGQWIQGVKNGQGIYYDSTTKVLYQGQWKDGKKNGYGLLKFSDKQYYQGTFVKSVKDGFGIQIFVNGDRYKGQYRKGKFHGKGKYTWANGSAYQGDFNQGMRHGNGTWKSAKKDGDIYVGNYQNDKKSGFGRYSWANGCIYQGNFLQDVKHGKGKLVYNDGRQIKGVWQEGSLVEAVEQNKKQRDQEDPLRKSKKNYLGSNQKIYA